jgi:Uma2 family endonuclease
VRAPDIAFVTRQRIPSDGIPRGYFPIAPDLAVEIVSPGDTVREVDDKVADWLAAGCCAVWVVNPRWKTVTIYLTGGKITMLTAEQTLDGGSVLPDFQCPVSEIFAITP